MKKRLLALLLCLFSLFSLFSCGSDLPDDVELPEGMQYAGGEPYGFYMFVPEEWTLSSMDKIVGAFVSTLDISSISLTEIEKPSGILFADFISSYVEDTMQDTTLDDFKIEKNGTSCMLGNIQNAKQYVYTYSYKPYEKDANKYRVMQIFGEYQGRVYAFTYTALDELKTEEATYFATHIEKVNSVIENIIFTTPKAAQKEDTVYEKDTDGYLRVAKKKLSGFDFYMHPDWECTLSSGIVEVVAPDRSSINMTEATDTGVSVDSYWAKRKSDLERYTDGAITVIKENKATTFANADQALEYEYTYTYRGEVYHTYQVIVVYEKIPVVLQKGYVFTFTATEASYNTHIGDVMKMIGKVHF